MPCTMLSSNALIWLLMLTIVQHSCLGRSMAEDALTPNLNSSVALGSGDNMDVKDNNVLTTLQDLGDLAVKIVTQVQGQEVDLNSITKMLTELAKSAVMVNSPKMPTTELEEEVNSLKQDVNQRIQELEEENEQMKETVRQLVQNSTLVPVIEKSRSEQNQPGMSYEFQAFADMNQTLTNKGIIQFSDVYIDESDSYNKHFGFYTCPDDGDYFISATITPYHMYTSSSRSYGMGAAHVKQGSNGSGRILFHMSASRVSSSRWSTGSGSYITHCKKGDNIWVEGAESSSSTSTLQAEPDDYETMFHIFKMK